MNLSGDNELHTRFNSSAEFLYGHLYPFDKDVYIQNETFTSTSRRYIRGRNIYVGYNVTNSKPQGDVIIGSNAHVVFDAAQNVVFDAGFECLSGGSFEVVGE